MSIGQFRHDKTHTIEKFIRKYLLQCTLQSIHPDKTPILGIFLYKIENHQVLNLTNQIIKKRFNKTGFVTI
jgi:hypothetical protein